MPFTQFGFDSKQLQYLAEQYIFVSLFGESLGRCSEFIHSNSIIGIKWCSRCIEVNCYNYYHEWQGPEIYAKALENDTIQINMGWTILDLMEVIQLAKKEAKVVGRPIDTQLLKYLFLRGAYATHGKYWEELNVWLNDRNMDELDMERLYQDWC